MGAGENMKNYWISSEQLDKLADHIDCGNVFTNKILKEIRDNQAIDKLKDNDRL